MHSLVSTFTPVIERHGYTLSLAFILVLAAALRFYNLGEFQQIVFDEVYFAKFGYQHLTGEYYFDTHPPLSKYLIGIGFWLYQILPWVNSPEIGTAEITDYNAVSWRWVNAVAGTVLCWVVILVSRAMHPSRILALVVGFLFAIEGILMVESRFGLNNIYIALFGISAFIFLGRAFAVAATPTKPKNPLSKAGIRTRNKNLFWTGIFLGLAYSIKWNGLGFSLVAWTLVFGPMALLALSKSLRVFSGFQIINDNASLYRDLSFVRAFICLVIVPLILYSILWQPYLMQFDKFGFIEMQKQILGYHSNSVGADEHPYCSSWYSWPLMLRPISYYFSSADVAGSDIKVMTDVHLFGNPVIFWASSLSIVVMAGFWLRNLYQWSQRSVIDRSLLFQSTVIIGYFASWLPWSLVSRCLFLYHYIPSACFSFMAFAWLLYRGLTYEKTWVKVSAGVVCVIVLGFFIYWLPIQLGIPLSSPSYYSRMWLRSWI